MHTEQRIKKKFYFDLSTNPSCAEFRFTSNTADAPTPVLAFQTRNAMSSVATSSLWTLAFFFSLFKKLLQVFSESLPRLCLVFFFTRGRRSLWRRHWAAGRLPPTVAAVDVLENRPGVLHYKIGWT